MLPKKSVQALNTYQTKNIDYKVKLDANEATSDVLKDFKDKLPTSYFRYPDNHAQTLRQKAASYYNTKAENIIAGNGSSEMLELILKTYLEKDDVVLGFEPSFTMFRVFTEIYAGQYMPVEANEPFAFDTEAMIQAAQTYQPKIIILCTPNNPTGNILSETAIKTIIESTNALVLVDEAYIEFYNKQASMIRFLKTYPRLIVLRSLSKAFGLAGIRLGFLFSNPDIIKTLNTVKSPYNLNILTQSLGIHALDESGRVEAYLSFIKKERAKMSKALENLNIRVFPSYANFVFFKSHQTHLFDKLLDQGILIRDFKGPLASYFRVSIGTTEDNEQFINALKEVTPDARD